MADISYDAVVRLADQLSPAEQKALVEHLQALAKQRALSFEEWQALFDSMKDDTPIVSDLSPRREDWYDDDGR